MAVKVGEELFELVPPDRFTFGEAKAFKRLTGGITTAEYGDAFGKLDPDALGAWVLLSIRRQRPEVPDDYLDDLEMGPVLATLEELVARPTDEADESDESSTAATDGHPPTPTSSDSSPSTVTA